MNEQLEGMRKIINILMNHPKVKSNSVLFNRIVRFHNMLESIEGQYMRAEQSLEQAVKKGKSLEANLNGFLMTPEFKDIKTELHL